MNNVGGGRPDEMQFSAVLPPNSPVQMAAEHNAVARMEEIMLSLGSESVSNIDMDQP